MRSSALFVITIVASLMVAQDKQFIDDWQKKANSRGAELNMKEVGRERANGHTIVAYRFVASGFPKDQHYTLWTWNLGSTPQAVADAYINADGLLVNRLANLAKGITEEPINAKVLSGRGEPKRFALTSDDVSLQAFAESIPFPLEAELQGCRLAVEMAGREYTAVVVRGSGFQPNSALSVEVVSGSEANKQQTTAHADGSYAMALMPATKGERAGKAIVSVKGPTCSVGIQFLWGSGSYAVQ